MLPGGAQRGRPGVRAQFSSLTLGKVLNFLSLGSPFLEERVGGPRLGVGPPAPGRDLGASNPLRAHAGA